VAYHVQKVYRWWKLAEEIWVEVQVLAWNLSNRVDVVLILYGLSSQMHVAVL
jgi:hypothetical protein